MRVPSEGRVPLALGLLYAALTAMCGALFVHDIRDARRHHRKES